MCQENGDKIINRVTVSGVIVSGVIVETETYHLGFVSVTFEVWLGRKGAMGRKNLRDN